MKKYEHLMVLGALAASILIILTIFFPALKNDNTIIMNGLKATFGGEIVSYGSFLSGKVNFNVLNLLAFILPLTAAVLLYYGSVKKRKQKMFNLSLNLFAIATFIFSVIVFADFGLYTTGTGTLLGMTETFDYTGAKLAYGIVIALVAATTGSVLSIVHLVSKFSKR